jgi:TonB family protein
MTSFIAYIIQSGTSLIALYLLYWLVLRNDTHYRLIRIVLLLSLLFSVILPLINLDFLPPIGPQNLSVPFNITFDKSVPATVPVIADAHAPGINYLKIITLVYVAGVFIVFARLIYQAIYLQAVSHLSDKKKMKGYTLVSMNSNLVPFSYFKRIYLPVPSIDDFSIDSIIKHEKSHMAQLHYMDLFIIEILAVLHWFNPIIWFYERSLKEIHEYLADEAVLSTGENTGKYKAILVNQAMGGPVFVFTNQFNQSLIKKRIIMMNKLKSSRWAKLKALLFVPVMATLLVAFANPGNVIRSSPGDNKITVKGKVTDQNSGKAIQGSAVVIKGTTTGTLTDAEGYYSLVADDPNATLVYSCVGFKTEEIPLGGNTTINVDLQTEVLTLTFSPVNNQTVTHEQTQTVTHSDKQVSHTNQTYVMVEENPVYEGGMEALEKFLQYNIQYPVSAKKNGFEGTVLVQYLIDKEGAVKQAKVMRGLSPELDQEALRVTNLITGWKPATQNGKSVERVVTMPILFKLP